MEISSRENRVIKAYRRLTKDAKYRRESGLFVVEGARLCADAVRSAVVIESALVTNRAAVQYAEIVDAVRVAAKETFEIPDSLATYLGDTDTPQGVFCICRLPLDELKPEPQGYYAALENIQDPGNLGTMIRTAEAFGFRGILLSDGCCDPYSPKVLRSSMGGVFRLPLYIGGSLAEQLPILEKQGFHSFACVVDTAATAVQKTVFPDGSVCVIGNEGNGLTAATVEACSDRITIPMAGRAESLNASMAAGIIFWEMIRG